MIRNRDVVTVKERRHTAELRETPSKVDVVQNTLVHIGSSHDMDFPTNEEVLDYVFGGG